MISFLRSIRQKLITKSKIRSYLSYAISEFILIVAGILFAIQIDNWNENRKLRNSEYEYLNQLNENLKATSTNLIECIAYNKRTYVSYEMILTHIKNDLPYSNSLDSSFAYFMYWADPNITYTAYETIKSKGFDIIQNDSLRNAIIEIYEESFPFLIGELQAEWEVYKTLVLPFVSKNIYYVSSSVAKPNNFEALKKSDEFLNIMGIKMRTREFSIHYAEMTGVVVDSLIKMIEKELENKRVPAR